MSNDFLRQILVNLNFIDGELPDSAKLSGLYNHLKNAIMKLNRAVGDFYSEQVHVLSSGATYNLESIPIVGTSLTRMAGSLGWLNPKDVTYTRSTNISVILAGHISRFGSVAKIDGFSHYNRREFVLPYPPVRFFGPSFSLSGSYLTSSTWAIESPGGGYIDVSTTYSNRVETLSQLATINDYYVSLDGVITLFRPLDNNEAFKVTYTFDTLGEQGPNSTFSVLPDFCETHTLCTVSLVNGSTFDITLPIITRTWTHILTGKPVVRDPGLGSYTTWASADDSAMKDYQAILPRGLTNAFGSGSESIPDGYLYIYDDDAGAVLTGGTFVYISSTQVRVTGLALEASTDRYRLVVPGSNLAEITGRLSRSFNTHNHSGGWDNTLRNFSSRISHAKCLNNIDEGGVTGSLTQEGFYSSALGPSRNPHPQYLHRYGFEYQGNLADGTTTSGNRGNALLGDLVISDQNGNLTNTTESFNLCFGHPGLGPILRNEPDNGALALQVRKFLSYKDVCTKEEFVWDGGKSLTKRFTPDSFYWAPGSWIQSGDLNENDVLFAQAAGVEANCYLHLPNGSIINSLYVLVWVSGTASVTAQGRYTNYDFSEEAPSVTDPTVWTLEGALEPRTGDGGVLRSLNLILVPEIIDNMSHDYYIRFVSGQSGDSIYGILVNYSLTNLRPIG